MLSQHFLDVKKFLIRNLWGMPDTILLWEGIAQKWDGPIIHESYWLFGDNEDNYNKNGHSKYGPNSILYYMNENGYRVNAHNYPNSGEVIAAFGCSNTVGVGLPWEETWCAILNKNLGDEYVVKNYGVSGCSNDFICRKIYNYLEIHKPKAIVCFFPNFSRAELIYPNENNMLFNAIDNIKGLIQREGHFMGAKGTQFIEFLNAYETIFNSEYAVYNFFKNLHFIKTICELKKVPFIWSTWDIQLNSINNILIQKKLDSNYVKANERLMEKDFARDNCHFGSDFNRMLANDFTNKLLSIFDKNKV